MQKISLVIPCKNEKESLTKVLNELKKYKNIVDEVLVVVDDKKDNSIKIIKNFSCKLIIQKKYGYGSAITEGFRRIKNQYGCIFNADFSFDPKYLKKMVAKTSNFNFVFGCRYFYKNAGSYDDTYITYIGNKIFTFICKNILNINLNDVLFTYVLCNKKLFNKLNIASNDFRLCIELPFLVQKNKFKYTEIPMIERTRYDGNKKVNEIKDGILILYSIIKCLYQKIFS